ncbi:hypothetical protein LOZ80_15095 [Paenibacillus sp. HWE-109]|uniref:hypothetical protein n=1 Tax=Paenibacillus sp. HWE-109 TaxID=1306526 RepID=UPI001EDDB6B5|nr:hypothetical protein [Paenibacillus sp. HWE-109]UKS30187.1 hypothetical protein LOZ80_15095 [Paenibacillus sp. HWE-109]
MSDIYVILIDGRPYLKENAIRTYKTRERANKEALKLVDYTKKYSSWHGKHITTAVFDFIIEEEAAN